MSCTVRCVLLEEITETFFCYRDIFVIFVGSIVRHAHLGHADMHMSCCTRCTCHTARDVHVVHRFVITFNAFDYNV